MAKNCDNCGHCYIEQVIHVCGRNEGRLPLFDGDGNCKGWKQKHLTNGDRIRAMSDEELANWFCTVCTASSECSCSDCKFYALECTFEEWLGQEVG